MTEVVPYIYSAFDYEKNANQYLFMTDTGNRARKTSGTQGSTYSDRVRTTLNGSSDHVTRID